LQSYDLIKPDIVPNMRYINIIIKFFFKLKSFIWNKKYIKELRNQGAN